MTADMEWLRIAKIEQRYNDPEERPNISLDDLNDYLDFLEHPYPRPADTEVDECIPIVPDAEAQQARQGTGFPRYVAKIS